MFISRITMKIILRGHIRDAFNDNRLYNLLTKFNHICGTIEIYIHTWNIIQSSTSWRKIKEINTEVTEELIHSYFKDLSANIEVLLIDDDKYIPLIGKTSGKLPNTKDTPLISWKRYWYGKFRIIENIYNSVENMDETAINFRFDILSNSNPIKEQDIITFIEANKNNVFKKNKFIKDYNDGGIDNIYIGSIKTMYELIWQFHHILDSIVESSNVGQEKTVFEKNELLFSQSV